MSESQAIGTMTEGVATGGAAGGTAEAYAAGLEAAVLQGLAQAIDNAVNAQQQLYTTGQAAFTEAVARRLSGTGEAPEPAGAGAAPKAPASDAQDLERRVAERLSSASAAGEPDPAAFTRGLMAAFAESLDMLAAVNAQQMMGYARVLIALGLDYQAQPISPAAARMLEEVLDGEALVQFLTALSAESRSSERPGTG